MVGDDFAGLLRELKERSGLSYGALGKRLHMSASTLHRYVSGEVVPVEFAPVERLARVCRATPEELLELHRRWIRADALRGVKKAEEKAEEKAEGKAEEKAEGKAEAGETAAAPEAADVATVAVAAEDAPSAAQAPGAQAPEAPEVPDVPDIPGVSGVPDVPEVSNASVAAGASEAPRRRMPRAAWYAATGVVAVSAAVALVANLVTGTGTGDDGQRGPAGAVGAAASPSTSVSGTATRSASPSASASPSPSSASPTTSASASASASAPLTRRSTAKPSHRAPASGPALTVTTTPYYWEVPCEHAFLVDRSPQNVLPPPPQQDVVGWATAYGAVSANRQTVFLTVQGTGEETVVIKDLHVRVVSRGPALDWNQYVMGNGCGGGVDTASFDVPLDLGNPLAMPVAGQRDFPYSVTESDPEVFHVKAHTSGHDVSWYLELEWSSGGRQGVMRVDDHGKPFRTSASKDTSPYAYPLGSNAWERVESND
ncbi:helix-turn-helix transcriptional regulator [Streptomyces sp. AC627_RSS907]|uniref:helix-turn-helix domain-containing protein n=1 Tax=Streptomyces sp. AC627_RSS907 TaxID=2823684 RepID=UPI001C22AA54|nr:helix-turn-helix transcriptional regulator [Streptomyces sp. AC627_RSS907]